MNAVNRLFIAMLSLAWIALMGFLVYLVWTPGEFIEITNSSMNTRFELIFETTAEQTLATIGLAILMLPAVMLLMMEATVRDNRGREAKLEHERNKQLQSRVEELESQLETERKRDADAVRRVAERDQGVEHVQAYDAEPTREADTRVTPARRWHMFGR